MLKLYSTDDGGQYADADGKVQQIGGYLSVDAYMARDDATDAPPASSPPSSNNEPPPLDDADIPL